MNGDYRGSGGKFYGATDPRNLRQFDPALFTNFQVGVTTKENVLKELWMPYG